MFRMKDIESWLVEEGIRTRISRGRPTLSPVEQVTLVPTGGPGLQTEGAVTVCGVQVRVRHQNFDRAEEIAQRIDEVFVPYDPLDANNGIWIGADEGHMTHIVSSTRRGGEPAAVAVTDESFTFAANYLFTAVRESRSIEEVRAGG